MVQRKKKTSDQVSVSAEGRQRMAVSEEEHSWQVGL